MSATLPGPDGRPRCAWCVATPQYLAYHDEEWGFPVADDRRLFEKLSLEAFQSGLSWRTILEKRDNFRRAFRDFDIERVARFDARSVERLLGDAGIVRHRGKIEAVIGNARRARELVAEAGSLAAWVWRRAPSPDAPVERVGAVSAIAAAMARELKARGWRFVGPTTVHAFLQSMGVLNDHAPGCVGHAAAAAARRRFRPPWP